MRFTKLSTVNGVQVIGVPATDVYLSGAQRSSLVKKTTRAEARRTPPAVWCSIPIDASIRLKSKA
jgi:hypothetical protein